MKRLYEFPCLFLFRGILRSVVLRIQVVELNRNIKTEVVGVLIIGKEKTVPTYSTVTLFAKLRGWSTSVPLITAMWYANNCTGMA